MRLFRRLVPFLILLLLFSGVWIWWNRPKKVDMSAYVPADALLYLEVNSLPQAVSGLVGTDGWKALSGPAGIKPGVGNLGWSGRLAAWTGIGAADTIVFSRMQIAATVLGIAAADGGDTLNVKPRIAIIVETHSSAGRTVATIEKHVGNFALRAYENPRVDKKDIDGTHWITWSSPSSERRIIAAMTGSVAIIGNDEKAVQACLAVRRGERPSLLGNLELENARLRVPLKDSLAFGFVSSQGAAALSELLAAVYLGQLSAESQGQNVAASIVPQVAKKLLGSIGWSTRAADGGIEDSYFVNLTNDAGARLRAALSSTPTNNVRAAGFLPSDTYSITRYETRDALSAWRGLNFSVSSQLDPVLAILVPRFLEATLSPYGIDNSDVFLNAIGPEVVTSRVENGGRNTVLLVEVRDENSLRKLVAKRLGDAKPGVEVIGDAELLSSMDESRGAASFVGGYLLMGPKESVRKCLLARQRAETFAASKDFEKSRGTPSMAGASHVLTLTRDVIPAQDFIVFIASQPAAKRAPADVNALNAQLGQLSYAISEMNFVEGGVEKRTRSTFGLLGSLVTQFSTTK